MSQDQAFPYSGPLYEQVHKVLRSRIMAGEWALREPLPGEALLSRDLGVSVGTVRKAMDQLTRENIVVRERGRGTFVRGDAEWRTNSAFRLCHADGRAISPQISLVDCSVAVPTDKEAKALRLPVRNVLKGRLLKLHREWRHDEAIVCREMITVEEVRFPGLRREMQAGAETLFSTYAEIYRTRVDSVQWAIGSSFREVGASERDPSEGKTSAASLLISRTAMDARGTPLELCEQTVFLDNCVVQINR